MSEKPPSVLCEARVLEYAVLDGSVTYTGHSSLFVGTGTEGVTKLGPVPCLVIAEDLNSYEAMLLHCDRDWEVLGLGGGHRSVAEAKAKAERAYKGVASRWIEAKVTREQALKFRDDTWANQRCSFCDRTLLDVDKMIERNNVRICNLCVARFERTLAEDTDPAR